MNVLGINAYHGDAAAALVVDGKLIAAVEEERINRVKHCAGFPSLAVAWCLKEGGLAPKDLEHIAIARKPTAHVFQKVMYLISKRPSFSKVVKDRMENAARVMNVKEQVAAALNVPAGELPAKLHNVEHHLAHLASSFLVSPYEDAALLSVDGFGDFCSTMLGLGHGTNIQIRETVLFPHSLGLFYTMVTQYAGFRKYGDEGKVMGLAPYGDPKPHYEAVSKIVPVTADGLFELDLDYFLHHSEGVDMTWTDGSPTIGRVFSPKMEEVFGPAREPGGELSQHYIDITASLQKVLEDRVLAIMNKLARETGKTNLCLAGGVALNSVTNGLIMERTPFREVYIQAAAGDSGTALGAAFQVYHQVAGRPRDWHMRDAYTGPGYSDQAYEAALQAAGLKYRRSADIASDAADIVSQGKILGWFQGRAEWGPRALGNRSIIADPRRTDMKDILNARIKHRESFRPFAPSVLVEHTAEWFEKDYPSPFMLMVYNVRPEKRAQVPAITHVDGTGRLQTVAKDENPRYYALIDAFRRKTGVPMVLNTSFNENEPIVCSPEDAVRCFTTTKMDALVLGDYLAEQSAK